MCTAPTSESRPRCWECQRRNRICNGAQPFCGTCIDAGLVCPGYGHQKPLTWLTPGKVVLRGQRQTNRTARLLKAGLTTPEDSEPSTAPSDVFSSSTSCIDNSDGGVTERGSVIDSNPVDALAAYVDGIADIDSEIEHAKASILGKSRFGMQNPTFVYYRKPWSRPVSIPRDLKPHEWDVIESAEIYNKYVQPKEQINLLIPAIAHSCTIHENALSYFDPVRRVGLVAMAISQRVAQISRTQKTCVMTSDNRVVSASSPTTAHLWETLYRHSALAVRTLNERLSDEVTSQGMDIFFTIHGLVCVEFATSTALHWRTHLNGWLAILNARGGLRAMLSSHRFVKILTLNFVIDCTIANSTSSSKDQIPGVYSFEMANIEHLYPTFFCHHFPCPLQLFTVIIRINRMRVRASSISLGGPVARQKYRPTLHAAARRLLHQVEVFNHELWREMFTLPDTDECRLIGEAFKAAVALYCLLSLSYDQPHAPSGEASSKKFYREHLFKLLEEGSPSAIFRKASRWPLVVAGVAAAQSSWDQKDTVHKWLAESGTWPGTGMALVLIKAALGRYWASGRTSWDGCFDRPYHVLY